MTERPPRQPIFNIPVSVLWFLGACILVHVVRMALSDEQDIRLLVTFAFIPARFASSGLDLPGGVLGDAATFVTYMFLHGDVMHLLINGLWMLAFGSAVAQRVGSLRFLLFSGLCGIAGAATHLAAHWGDVVPVVGASAAISGQMAGAIRFVFGAPGSGGIMMHRRDPRTIPLTSIGKALRDPRILGFLAFWIGMNLLFGLGVVTLAGAEGPIAWEAHLGGFLAGLMTFGLFDRAPPPPRGLGDLWPPD